MLSVEEFVCGIALDRGVDVTEGGTLGVLIPQDGTILLLRMRACRVEKAWVEDTRAFAV